jgi:hypothetical protein
MVTLGDRLAQARASRFVGRLAEVELFTEALEASDPPFSVLFLYGPGGVGKTTLLQAFARVAAEHGVSAVRVDLRTVEATPSDFLAASAPVADRGAPQPEGEATGGVRCVLLVDTFERGVALDGWLRETFLPTLPDSVLVVIAGRNPPTPAWRSDPGWLELLRVVSLRNLGPDEGREILQRGGLPPEQHDRVLAITHGHPLALTLWLDLSAEHAARGTSSPLTLDAVPDVVAALLECFLDALPSDRHRSALAVAARVRETDEGLLASVVGADHARAMFDWLRSLSFIEETERGLCPHDLARDVLDAELRWRDRPSFVNIHHQVRSHIIESLERASGADRYRQVVELVHLHRRAPVFAAFVDFAALDAVRARPLEPGDRPKILAMLERHQGSVQAGWAERWIDRQPSAFVGMRAPDGDLVGMAAYLRLHEADQTDIESDPVTATMWDFVSRHDPPRPGEEVTGARFFVDEELNQEVPSPSFDALTLRHTEHMLSQRNRAWDMVMAMADPDRFEPIFDYVRFDRRHGFEVEIGGASYGLFARDWRREDLATWLDHMVEVELGDPVPPRDRMAPTMVLSEQAFAAAVRDALRSLHRPEVLAANPLMRSRLVRDRGGDEAAPEVLRELVAEAAAAVAVDPRDDRYHRALDRTYLRPASSQEKAAELLDLPFSTYRRHLARGVDRVTAWLWQRELFGAP